MNARAEGLEPVCVEDIIVDLSDGTELRLGVPDSPTVLDPRDREYSELGVFVPEKILNVQSKIRAMRIELRGLPSQTVPHDETDQLVVSAVKGIAVPRKE